MTNVLRRESSGKINKEWIYFQSHYSITKGAHWLGFGTDYVRRIPVNSKGRMIIQKLDEAIQEELDMDRCPIFVNGTAGTTVLGAIDDIDAIADVCQKYGIWMHVDVSSNFFNFFKFNFEIQKIPLYI